jgi:hypothetical protein
VLQSPSLQATIISVLEGKPDPLKFRGTEADYRRIP